MLRPGNLRCATLLALAFALTVGCQRGSAQEQEIIVAAASSLAPLLDELRPALEERSGARIIIVPGASATLLRQLDNGAPWDVFLPAASNYAQQAAQLDRCDPASRSAWARGGLALVHAPRFDDERTLGELLAETERRIAIAHPEHAPYGSAAIALMRQSGVPEADWRERLIIAPNALESLRVVTSNNADAGLIALVLAVDSHLPYEQQPTPQGDALVHEAIVCSEGRSGAARRFVDALRSPTVQARLVRHGYLSP